MYELYCQWHITVLCMLPLALDSNKSPTHEYDNGIYSSNLKEDRVNEVRQCNLHLGSDEVKGTYELRVEAFDTGG